MVKLRCQIKKEHDPEDEFEEEEENEEPGIDDM